MHTTPSRSAEVLNEGPKKEHILEKLQKWHGVPPPTRKMEGIIFLS